MSRISIETTLWETTQAPENHYRETEAKLESYILKKKTLQSGYEDSYHYMCMSWEVLLFTDKKQGLRLLSNRKKMGSGNKTTIWVKFKTTEMCLSGWNTVV